jgi:hypothetical protein
VTMSLMRISISKKVEKLRKGISVTAKRMLKDAGLSPAFLFTLFLPLNKR